MELTSKQRRFLRASAHSLKPVVWMGDKGMTTQVVEKVSTELTNHELIKVKVADGPLKAKEAGPMLAKGTRSALVQVIGHTVVLYKRRKKEPEIKLPKA